MCRLRIGTLETTEYDKQYMQRKVDIENLNKEYKEKL